MNWRRPASRTACALLAVNASWMMFDGARALVVGDYVTPGAGPYMGQLGPWADLLRGLGIEPRSTAVKIAFVVYGAALLAGVVRFLRASPRARPQLIGLAIAGLWYVPVGTVLHLLSLALLAAAGADPGRGRR